MSLAEYASKRDFRKTSEPKGKRSRTKGRRFVVQKHAATRLHFDLRFEIGGVLVSWAVPKGLPYDHGAKRLAVRVEDHPVDYLEFEGCIPKGEYGGGTVMVWDTGEYREVTPAAEIDAKGKFHFELDGGKLAGEWYLVRLRSANEWLVIRGGEDHRQVTVAENDRSILSGRSMAEIASGGNVTPRPEFVSPMQATTASAAPPGDWLYEIKFDGWRAQALVAGRAVALLSRNANDLTAQFPEIAHALAKLPVKSALIDGELVALDELGRSSFQMLQAFVSGDEVPPIYYYAFDLLSLDGCDLRSESIEKRKRQLADLLVEAPDEIRFSADLGGDVDALMERIRPLGLEGLIGKRVGSKYETGRRSAAWVKLKLRNAQEFVIGGFTPPAGGREHFGALILGLYEGRDLVCVGKVGSGFSSRVLADLHRRMTNLSRATCPFRNLPERSAGRWLQGITPAVMKTCGWVRPSLVCQVEFTEWTRDNRLRQPVYLGLRDDKQAGDVTREA